MGMNLDGPIYLRRNGFLSPEKRRTVDLGPQNIYDATPGQISEFITRMGASTEGKERVIAQLVARSTPSPDRPPTFFSEVTDLTDIEYASIEVCPGAEEAFASGGHASSEARRCCTAEVMHEASANGYGRPKRARHERTAKKYKVIR
jgi:hypothetical protein